LHQTDAHAANTRRARRGLESRPQSCLQECKHECKCMQCAKEREVKESVRIELVKALRQARFILTGEI
jgi:hypothetical protein